MGEPRKAFSRWWIILAQAEDGKAPFRFAAFLSGIFVLPTAQADIA